MPTIHLNYAPLNGELATETGGCAECGEPVGSDDLTWLVALELPGAFRGIHLHQRCAVTVGIALLRAATREAADGAIERAMGEINH